jgi:hypothetical protein
MDQNVSPVVAHAEAEEAEVREARQALNLACAKIRRKCHPSWRCLSALLLLFHIV